MENQYNYYNSEGMNGNYQYGGYDAGPQPEPEKPEKKKKTGKGVPKAVAIGGLAHFVRSCVKRRIPDFQTLLEPDFLA